MNNFNDYYNYLNNYNDMNFMTNPNTMITDMNYQNMFPNNYITPNTSTNNNIADSQIGFKRGNLFSNLYDEYKNYKPQELKASNEREDLILQIDENRFAIIELGLYLDLPRFSMRSSIAGSSRAKKASATSLSVSKQHLPMLGPMAARSV